MDSSKDRSDRVRQRIIEKFHSVNVQVHAEMRKYPRNVLKCAHIGGNIRLLVLLESFFGPSNDKILIKSFNLKLENMKLIQ